MLVGIPIGLWVFSLACDLIAVLADVPALEATAFHAMVGGVLGALAAAVPGFIDMLSLRDPHIKKTALAHMALNLTLVALYTVNAWMRYDGGMPREILIGLSVVGVLILSVSGWLGGKMVFEAGVAVHASDTTPSESRVGQRSPQPSVAQRAAAGAALPGERAMASDAAVSSDKPRVDVRGFDSDRPRDDRPR